MASYMMVMKGSGGSAEQWAAYIEILNLSGTFRGGSELGNGHCLGADSSSGCSVSGFMRFEADSIEKIVALANENPLLKSGGSVEVLELIET